MSEAVDDFPQLERVAHVGEGGRRVARCVLEEREVEVAEDCVGGVDADGALEDDDGFARELEGGVLLVEAVEERGELVVDACDFGVEYAIDLLVERKRL